MTASDLSALSMSELFRMDARGQTELLTEGLLALERDPNAADALESCMRAAHSLKGAARIVGLNAGVSVTHAMEDCFVAAQTGRVSLQKAHIDLLLRGVDLITEIASVPEAQVPIWSAVNQSKIAALVAELASLWTCALDPVVALPTSMTPARSEVTRPQAGDGAERILRVSAQSLDRLLGLAGESLVQSRWLSPFAASLLTLKRQHQAAGRSLDILRDELSQQATSERAQRALSDARAKLASGEQVLAQRLAELEAYERRAATVASRLYEETLTCRMRPFADGIQGFHRMVRDLARTLGKEARLDVSGEATPVDRDVLVKLEAPLMHLLRNAVDHGMDETAARVRAGKPRESVVRLDARHAGGMLQISVSDDGPGIDTDRVRQAIVSRGLLNIHTARKLSDAELFEFLFLPGFTVKDEVTEISGRGVGLDAVLNMVKELPGSVRASSRLGEGTRFQLTLPLTVSVVRTLLAEIGGEPYAFPLASIERAVTIARSQIESVEGRQHFELQGRQIGIVTPHQVLGCDEIQPASDECVPVIVLADGDRSYGLVVERFIGCRELAVQPLDPRLGKIKDISACAVLQDGSPVLVVDVDDLTRSIQRLSALGDLSKMQYRAANVQVLHRKRVLVVDDSLTVRALQRKLLLGAGYDVEVAVDGFDGWNAVRTGDYNLVVTDIDMPRMDGIELLKLIRQDQRLHALPVMIVSYKDRVEDHRRGLDAGADFYLAKGNFHDGSVLRAVNDLIGEPDA